MFYAPLRKVELFLDLRAATETWGDSRRLLSRLTASDAPDTEANENDARPEGETAEHSEKDRIRVWIVVESQARVEHDADEGTRPKNEEHKTNLNETRA